MKEWTMMPYLLSEKGYCLWNHPTIEYNDGKANRFSMGWINLVVGSPALHNVTKYYVNVVNEISTFVEPTPPTNLITN